MANEATITAGLTITKTGLQYRSLPATFRADVTGTKGPTPGALTIPTGGKVVSFSELTTPGFCVIKNLDSTNYVEYGAWDPDTDRAFLPFELGPGETAVVKLSRNITEEWIGTGTGTSSAGGYTFFMKANTADVIVSVEAFER